MEHRPALAAAHEAAAAYLDGVRERRVEAAAADVAAAFAGPLPEYGAPPAEVVARLVAAADAGIVATAGPRYFGYVMGGALPSTVAADWLAAAWDQIAGMEVMSPAASAAEAAAGAWILELLGLPADASFGFPTGAQMANFTAIATARHAVLARAGWDVESHGLQGAPRIQTVMGGQSHATIPQALRYAGLGGSPDLAASDDQGRLHPEALAHVLRTDGGPAIVCAQAGNVNSGSFDPFDAIADICAERGAWLHVDGAFGLWAAASPRLRTLVQGVERADSWATDCHKWLNVPYDSAFVATRDPAAHAAAMSWDAPYVVPGAGREPYRYVPEASRRARGFAVWSAFHELGRHGIADMIDRSCLLARRFARGLSQGDPGVAVLNDVVLNQVLVRFDDSDERTRAVIAGVQEAGVAWLSGSTWDGEAVMRISVTNWMTTTRDIDLSVASILRVLRAVRALAVHIAAGRGGAHHTSPSRQSQVSSPARSSGQASGST